MRYFLRAGAPRRSPHWRRRVLLFHDASPTPVAAAEPPAQVGAELAMVPADAVGFIHVRLADLWKNDVMEGFRKTWEKAGPKRSRALDKQFVPAPSTITRGTAFVLIDEHKQPRLVFILTFSKSFDPRGCGDNPPAEHDHWKGERQNRLPQPQRGWRALLPRRQDHRDRRAGSRSITTSRKPRRRTARWRRRSSSPRAERKSSSRPPTFPRCHFRQRRSGICPPTCCPS